LLGNADDISPSDPIFILRRAISYRNSSSRHRISAPLDEVALHHLHRESASSASSDAQVSEDGKARQPSKQEIIAAQRRATQANQRAILSAQANSLRGVDVVLAGNAILRSSRYEVDDKMRYSYVQPDGETYDISDIIEEEWRENNVQRNDLLEGVLVRNKDGIGDKIDRVLSKIKNGKANTVSRSNSAAAMDSLSQSTSISEYSLSDPVEEEMSSRASTPGFFGRSPTPTGPQRSASPTAKSSSPTPDPKNRSRASTPTAVSSKVGPGSRRQPSIASVMSDLTYSNHVPNESSREGATPRPQRKKPVIPEDDFGVAHMMAIIEYTGTTPKTTLPPLHPVDELLYGRKFDVESLHPAIKELYSDSFKKLDDMDKVRVVD
jgi:hypothetical protein